MTPIKENAALGSDLDCGGNDIRNIRNMFPVPAGLVSIDDPRLSGPRTLPNASVFDQHVSDSAGIAQSKLNFNGLIPTAWLSSGSSDVWAAPGNLAEQIANKGVASGYAPLNSVGILPAANVTPTGNPGTVNSIAIVMPPELSVAAVLAGSVYTFTTTWASVPDGSWFGVNGLTSLDGKLKPQFLTGKLPIGLIPSLAATKFTTGVFDTDQLPVATPIGAGHAPGIIPDPGAVGGPTEYLGRDMAWHFHNANLPYQPFIPKPGIVLASWGAGSGIVNVTSNLKGATLFYRKTDPGAFTSQFAEVISPSEDNKFISLPVVNGSFVEAYTAKEGYNTQINSYVVAGRGD